MKSLLIDSIQKSDDRARETRECVNSLKGEMLNKDRLAAQKTENECIKEGLHTVETAVGKLQSDVKHHDMAIEDMIESWEEFQQENRQQNQQMKELFSRIGAEDRLMELCVAYEQQMHMIRRMAAGDPSWEKQLALVDTQLQPIRDKAGFLVISKKGDPVDYALHEVISVQETEEEEKNGRIESVYEPGFCRNGQVYRKAKVGAYRYHGPAKNENEGLQ